MPLDRFARVNQAAIPRYTTIERGFTTDLLGQVEGFLSGGVDEAGLLRWFDSNMRRAQEDAFLAGRSIRGAGSGVSDSEAAMIVDRSDRQMRYFRRFVRDMAEGRGRLDYSRRAELYGKSLWSLFLRGETVDWDDPAVEARYHWVMDPAAEHCRDCIARATESMRRGGFTLDEITAMGWPGEADTECIVNCRCHVRVTKKSRPVLPDAPERGGPPPGFPGTGATVSVRPSTMPAPPVQAPPAPAHPVLDAVRHAAQTGGMAVAGMPTIPAAGIPMAAVSGEPIVRFLRQARDPRAAAMAAARLPEVLAYPVRVDASGAVRSYYGAGIRADLARTPDGLWVLAALSLAAARPKEEEDDADQLA